jgi:hypothetical protein
MLRFLGDLAADPPAPFEPGSNGGDDLLNLLAWCASAAGVAGLLIVGMQLALQLRRGEPGEAGDYFRGAVYVLLACIIAATAGPLVTMFGPFGLS